VPVEMSTLALLTVTGLALSTAGFVYLRASRAQIYRRMAVPDRALDVSGPDLNGVTPGTHPSFAQRLAVLDDILPAETFGRISAEIEALVDTERSYLPTHKKGGTVAYDTLCAKAPHVVALYRSPRLHALVSDIVGVPIQQTPLHDQSSLSVLFYEKPGDHIGWHYDHNFYRGRHFTVLIPIVNRGREVGALSSARLLAKPAGGEIEVSTSPNRMIVFEGARVLHKVTPIGDGERRVILSMTFCSDPRNSLWQGVARRIKDTAFFGIRALWT